MTYDRYEHHFTVSAIRTPAGISWSLEDHDIDHLIWDRENLEWVPLTGLFEEEDQKMTADLSQRLYILT